TFIIWGALNAIYFLPLLLTNRNRQNLGILAEGNFFPSMKEILNMAGTFGLIVMAWIFFRATDITHAFKYLGEIFSASVFSIPNFKGLTGALITLILILIFVFIEWIGRNRQYAISHIGCLWKRPKRWAFYYSIILALYWF